MRAIRVRRSHGVTTAHWLTDDEGTRCGKDVEGLDILEELDVDKLPPVEACHGCARAVEGGDAVKPDYRHTRSNLPPALRASTGRLSKQGPLRHTGRSGQGNPLR